jgi:hypothetical protein
MPGIAAMSESFRGRTHVHAGAGFHPRAHSHAGHPRHAHVAHIAHRPGVHGGYRSGHACARREGGAGVAAAILGLGEDGVGGVARRLNDQVIGFAGANAELIDRDRLDIAAVGGHNEKRQARDAHVEGGHRRAVDEAQPHPLAGFE